MIFFYRIWSWLQGDIHVLTTLGLSVAYAPSSVWHYVGGPLSRRSLCLFWRETKQRPELEISTGPEVGKGTPVKSWKKELSAGSWRRARQKGSWQSTPDSRRDHSAWDRVYRCKKEYRVSQLNLLALELTQAYIVRLFFVLFLPLPWLYFL